MSVDNFIDYWKDRLDFGTKIVALVAFVFTAQQFIESNNIRRAELAQNYIARFDGGALFQARTKLFSFVSTYGPEINSLIDVYNQEGYGFTPNGVEFDQAILADLFEQGSFAYRPHFIALILFFDRLDNCIELRHCDGSHAEKALNQEAYRLHRIMYWFIEKQRSSTPDFGCALSRIAATFKSEGVEICSTNASDSFFNNNLRGILQWLKNITA